MPSPDAQPDREVDRFVVALDAPWPRRLAADVVTTIRAAGSMDESIRWGQPFFARRGRGVVKLFVAREWIDVFLYRGADVPDPDGLLGPGGASAMRRLQLHRGAGVPAGLGALVERARSLADDDR